MPQMAPMWWTCLMMMFTLMLMTNMSLTYFNYNKLIMIKNIKMNNNYKWMW